MCGEERESERKWPCPISKSSPIVGLINEEIHRKVLNVANPLCFNT